MGNDYDFIFKIVLIGNAGVGKSSLLLRYVDNMFFDSYISTIGVDFKVKTIDKTKLQIWDTDGQERFNTIIRHYYSNCNAILLIFSLNDINSFEKLSFWLNEIYLNCKSKPVLFV